MHLWNNYDFEKRLLGVFMYFLLIGKRKAENLPKPLHRSSFNHHNSSGRYLVSQFYVQGSWDSFKGLAPKEQNRDWKPRDTHIQHRGHKRRSFAEYSTLCCYPFMDPHSLQMREQSSPRCWRCLGLISHDGREGETINYKSCLPGLGLYTDLCLGETNTCTPMICNSQQTPTTLEKGMRPLKACIQHPRHAGSWLHCSLVVRHCEDSITSSCLFQQL